MQSKYIREVDPKTIVQDDGRKKKDPVNDQKILNNGRKYSET